MKKMVQTSVDFEVKYIADFDSLTFVQQNPRKPVI